MFQRSNWDHRVQDITTLQLGDHIYRHLGGNKRFLGYHHGIVVRIPPVLRTARKSAKNGDDCKYECKLDQDQMYEQTHVFEMTRLHGMQVTTLKKFAIHSVRKVKYGVSSAYVACHRAGTCYTQEQGWKTAQYEYDNWFRNSYDDTCEPKWVPPHVFDDTLTTNTYAASPWGGQAPTTGIFIT